MQSSALRLGSSNRLTCSQVKAVRSQCCHGLVQRRCTSFLPALRQQFSTQQMLPFGQHTAMVASLKPRRCSRSLNTLLLAYTTLQTSNSNPTSVQSLICCCFGIGRLGNQQRCVGLLAYTNIRWGNPAIALHRRSAVPVLLACYCYTLRHILPLLVPNTAAVAGCV